MKTMKTVSLVGLVVVGLLVVAGNSWALDWKYQYDSASDASGGDTYEVYRMGYAFDQDKLYFNLWTGLPKTGGKDATTGGNVAPGDLYINVGGSLSNGYTGTGVNADYAKGNVFGLALTSHAGDMNNDLYNATYYPTHVDDAYPWSPVTEGHLYSNAMFSTGAYEAYAGASGTADGGNDPFGLKNNAPAHIAEFGADLGNQSVAWNALGSKAVDAAGKIFKNVYEVQGVISLSALGIKGGEKIELAWSMECGNDFLVMDPAIAPSYSGVPEPGTLVLLGLGLLSIVGVVRKQRS